MEEKPFSDTLRAVLLFAKAPGQEFSFDSVREMLASLYSDNMRIIDVLIVLNRAMEDVLGEPRFCRQSASVEYFNLLTAPIRSNFKLGDQFSGPGMEDSFTIEEYLTSILHQMMSFFMLTNVGWCREYLDKGRTC